MESSYNMSIERIKGLIETYHPDMDVSPNGYNKYGNVDFGHSLAEAIINPNSIQVPEFIPSYSKNMTSEEAMEESISRIRGRWKKEE